MASLVARALTEDHPQGGLRESGVDRVLAATFWRPQAERSPAPVVSLAARRSRDPVPGSHG